MSFSSQHSWPSQPKPSRRSRRPGAGVAEARLGQVLGSYRLLDVLGVGGMGTVYRAEHIKLGREVALKLLHEDYAQRRDAVARFFQEARAVNKIRHQNIVDISDLVELDSGTTFLVMELLTGVPLTRLMRGAAELETTRALAILLQICDGLSAAHSVGIVHRDLKPDNIFITINPDGTDSVKLLDFGVAKLTGGDQGEMGAKTVAGAVIGTPAFMSPEQAGGLRVDARSDVYSLGAIMYEMFTRTPMFRGKSFGDYVRKHLSETPMLPSRTSGGANIDPQLEEIVLRALKKSPTERYQSAQELRVDILAAHTRLSRAERSAEQIALPAAGDLEPATEPVPALRSQPGGLSSASSPMLATMTPSGFPLPTPGAGTGPGPEQTPAAPAEPTPSGPHISWSHLPASHTPPAFPSHSSPSAFGLDTSLTAGDLPRDPTQQRSPWRLPLLFGGGLLLAAGAAIALLVASDDRGDEIMATSESERESAPLSGEASAPAGGSLEVPKPIVKPIETGGEKPKRGNVTVRFASRPHAEIYALGSTEPICTTPCDVTIDPEDGGSPQRRDYVLRRRGYQDERVSVNLRAPPERIERELSRRATSRRRRPSSSRQSDIEKIEASAKVAEKSDAEPKKSAPKTGKDKTGGEKSYDPQDTLDPFGS